MSTALPPSHTPSVPPSVPKLWRRLLDTPFRELVSEGATGSLNWRVLLAKSEAPEPIRAAIAQVVRKTGLWRTEKHAVTAELLAHFEDGLEAGATAEELVESFGDPAVAAKLIRRGKVRCRSAIWQAWWWTSRAMLTACVAYFAYGAYLLTQRPNPSIDYLAVLNANLADTPTEETGWPLYYKAFTSLQEKADTEAGWQPGQEGERPWFWGRDADQWLGKPYTALEPTLQVMASDWLDSRQDELAWFREAASKPLMGIELAPPWAVSEPIRELFRYGELGARDPESEDLFSILLPHSQEARSIGRVLFSDLTRAVERGDGETTLADLTALLGIARQAGEHPFLVCCLIEGAIRRMAIEALNGVLREDPGLWSNKQMVAVAHDLAKPPRPLRFYLEGEFAGQLDFVQRVYSERGELTLSGLRRLGNWTDGMNAPILLHPGAEGSLLVRLGQCLALPSYAIGLADREETTRVLSLISDSAKHDSELPLWRSDEYRMPEDKQTFFETQNVVASLVSPASVSARMAYERSEGLRQGALIGIALELARRDSGQWPDSLSELAPSYLPELPIDPINGGPLGYRLVEGQPVVYSLGVDGDDDLGRLPADMDDAGQAARGHVTVKSYRVRAPLREPERTRKLTKNPSFYDGDWVLWSLAEPRYLPDAGAGSE